MLDKWQKILERDYAFTKSPEGFRDQYAKIGQTHTDGFEFATRCPRFNVVRDLLFLSSPEKVLDAGCGQSEYIINLSNIFPETQFVGADIDPSIIDWQKHHISLGRAKYPENVTAIRVDSVNAESCGENFDAALACEVLEHVRDPRAWLQGVESCVKLGGAVILTVPFGPWEHMSYDSYPYRCHLWEFSVQDLEDLAGKKPGFAVQALTQGVNDKTGDVIGWYFVRYFADHKPCGEIDMERKLWLQRPRQMVSASLIAGPNAELTLAWCLDSIRGVAAEIIIGDTGLSPAGQEIAKQYGAKIIQAPNPLEHGFDEARNATLAHCTHEWILWIDTDERLLDPVLVNKYLRANRYAGYGVRQHHFAVDTTYQPDMPCRLFRNHRGIKFFGSIHEHPEHEVNKGPGETIVLSDINIAHVGYLCESVRKQRFWRNLPLVEADKKKNPDRLLQKHFICRDNMMLAGELLDRNGGKVDEDVQRLCQEVIDLFRKHFLGRPSYVNVDTLPYYSQACKILDKGVDVRFSVEAARQGVGDPVDGTGIRFATVEDAMAEIQGKSKALIEPLMSQGW